MNANDDILRAECGAVGVGAVVSPVCSVTRTGDGFNTGDAHGFE